jgi:hypothetical protein
MALPKSLTKVTPPSKSIALIFFITLPLLGYMLGSIFTNSQVKCPTPKCPVTRLPSPTPTLSPSNSPLLFYTNPEIGLSFHYPSWLGEPYLVRQNFPAGVPQPEDKGKLVYIKFSNLNSTIFISAYSDDYSSLNFEEPNRTCQKDYFTQKTDGNFSRQCKTVNINGLPVVWANNFKVQNCTPLFFSTYYLTNSQSSYKNIEVYWSVTQHPLLIESTCFENTGYQVEVLASQLAQVLSQEVLDYELSLSSDVSDPLNSLKTIVSTMKFSVSSGQQ